MRKTDSQTCLSFSSCCACRSFCAALRREGEGVTRKHGRGHDDDDDEEENEEEEEEDGKVDERVTADEEEEDDNDDEEKE